MDRFRLINIITSRVIKMNNLNNIDLKMFQKYYMKAEGKSEEQKYHNAVYNRVVELYNTDKNHLKSVISILIGDVVDDIDDYFNWLISYFESPKIEEYEKCEILTKIKNELN